MIKSPYALFACLYSRICPPVAGMAQGHKIAQPIGFSEIVKIAPGHYMMDCLTRLATMLAGIIITCPRLAFLGLPVWAIFLTLGAVYIAWVIFANPILIPTGPAAVFATTRAPGQPGWLPIELATATLANEGDPFFLPIGEARILALTRTINAAPVCSPVPRHCKTLATVWADSIDRFSHAQIIPRAEGGINRV